MMFLTHALFALLCSLVAAEFLGVEDKLLFSLVAVAAALLADIDNARSSIGQRLEPYARALNFLFKHRGLLHSIWLPLLLLLLLININKTMALAILTGYFSHLLIDALTIEGIKPFYPLKYRLKGFVRTGGLTEQIIMVMVFVSIIALSTGQP